jgi:hypothetical protein
MLVENIIFKLNTDDKIKKELNDFEHVVQKDEIIEQKLDELIDLLSTSGIDSKKAKEYQKRFNQGVQNSVSYRKKIMAFKQLDNKANSSREELLDEFTILLSNHEIDSRASQQYLKSERLRRGVLIAIGVMLITLGFAMIVMPAPPYFEMFTIFYFTRDDGVTLMDLISVLIILVGVYLFIRSVTKPIVER